MSLTEFPLFRKYCNAQTHFKVESKKVLIERQIIGEKYFETKIIARQFPEMLKIRELIERSNKIYCTSTQEEFESISKSHTIIKI